MVREVMEAPLYFLGDLSVHQSGNEVVVSESEDQSDEHIRMTPEMARDLIRQLIGVVNKIERQS